MKIASSFTYELVANNFTCPDFHSCVLMDSLSACEEKIQTGAATLCKTVSTHFASFMRYTCGKSFCNKIINQIYPGPDKAMALLHHDTIEKAYRYVAENYISLAAIGLGTFALAYLTYRTVEKLTRSPKFLENIELSEVPSILERADISVGHWDGIHVCYEGLSETTSFRQVSNVIERLYSKSVRFMRKKQESYERSLDPFTLFAIVILCPLYLFLQEPNTPPRLNHFEEAQVRSAIEIRQRAYAQLNALLDEEGSFFETLTRIWNNTIGRVGFRLKAPVERDSKLLEEMVSRRKRNESITDNLEWASKDYADGKRLNSRVILAASIIPGIVHLVAHVALMAIYSCFIFSKTWGDTVSLVSKDVVDDLNNLRTAAQGIFRPESVSMTR